MQELAYSSLNSQIVLSSDPATPSAAQDDPEDILGSSLESLYDWTPITHSSAGSDYTYFEASGGSIILSTPNTRAENWSLHASSIWVASLYIADHLEELRLDDMSSESSIDPVHILELGAGAGLPSILVAKTYPTLARVTSSDYPDENLIRALQKNVERNGVRDNCRVVPFAWNPDTSALLPPRDIPGFDVIIAADTLWNPALHTLFIETLRSSLARNLHSRIQLVAGMHTGRYTIQSFLAAVSDKTGLEVVEATEREVKGDSRRSWDVERAEREDEKERRRWVVWIMIKWKAEHLLS